MDFLHTLLFDEKSVAHAILVIAAVATSGLALGSYAVRGVKLGIAGVLFTGILVGHFGITVNHEILEFLREMGLVLFVYMVGLQVGPGFFASLRQNGLKLNMLAASIVFLGLGMALLVHLIGGVELPVAVGLLAGGVTNTPSLGAAQQALRDILGATHPSVAMPGVGYAIAYPFGILGILLAMLIIRMVLRISVPKEAHAYAQDRESETENLETMSIIVENQNLDNLTLREIPGLKEIGVNVSRIRQGDEVKVATGETPLRLGDIIHAVGSPAALRKLEIIVGHHTSDDLSREPSNLTVRSIIVTAKEVLGKSLGQLNLRSIHNVTLTRVRRGDVELLAAKDLQLQFGDVVRVVGELRSVQTVEGVLGNSTHTLYDPKLSPIFFGIILGVILGSIPISLPGFPAPVRLGLAGGPLVVSIILSRLAKVGPVISYFPRSANLALREFGIILFLSCVGLKAGGHFFETLLQGDGLYWMGCAALITFVPLIIVGFIGRVVMKVNYLSLCGLLAGSMTDPPALAFANTLATSDAPSLTYATVYPLVMLLRVLTAQALVVLLM